MLYVLTCRTSFLFLEVVEEAPMHALAITVGHHHIRAWGSHHESGGGLWVLSMISSFTGLLYIHVEETCVMIVWTDHAGPDLAIWDSKWTTCGFFYQEGSCAEQPTRWPGAGGRSVFSLWAMFLQICVCIRSLHSNCCNGQILNYCTSLTASQVSYIIYTRCLPKPCSGSICTVLCNA